MPLLRELATGSSPIMSASGPGGQYPQPHLLRSRGLRSDGTWSSKCYETIEPRQVGASYRVLIELKVPVIVKIEYALPERGSRMISRAPTIAHLFPTALHLINPEMTKPSELKPQASAGEVDQVVVWLVDGFGYDQIVLALSLGLMPNLKERLESAAARLDAIQTVNPSMTAVALASLLTGVTPARHGIVGQVVYHKGTAVDVLRGPLPETLRLASPDVGTLAEKAGLTYDAVLQNNILRGPLTSLLHQNLDVVRTYIRESGIPTVLNELLAEEHRGIVYLYTSGVDAINHSRGAFSSEWRAEVESLDRYLAQMRAPDHFNSWLWITADHGHVPMHGVIHYRELRERLPGLPEHAAQVGTAIAVDAFDLTKLRTVLADIAPVPVEVIPVDELVANGYFGETEMDSFRARLGTYVLQPASGWCWVEAPGDAHAWSHGGTTSQEMTVPWVQLKLPVATSRNVSHEG